MPFGKYKGLKLQDVPASELLRTLSDGCDNIKVLNYIRRCKRWLELEVSNGKIITIDTLNAKEKYRNGRYGYVKTNRYSKLKTK